MLLDRQFKIAFNVLVWLLAAGLSPAVAIAKNAIEKDPCQAMPSEGTVAAKSFFTFDRFDAELRAAISRQDAVAVAFLVKFPLTVNDAHGRISIDDAGALKAHFQEVFTPAVRNEILREKLDNTGCGDEGLMYGPGTIWVNATERGYAIVTVNRDATPPIGNPWKVTKINYICQTSTHRIVVDTIAGGVLRYRSWNRPRPVTDAPDLQILKGEGTFEGSGICAYPVYTFTSGNAVYRVEGDLGCGSDSDEPPKDVTGNVEVTVGKAPPTTTWCY